MLAQSFMTAKQLDITKKQKQALIKTLVLLETDKLKMCQPLVVLTTKIESLLVTLIWPIGAGKLCAVQSLASAAPPS